MAQPLEIEFPTPGGPLWLAFARRDDRFHHHAWRAGSDARLSEVDASAAGPCFVPGLLTPVYSELHQQGDVVFLSGHAGGAYWSACVRGVQSPAGGPGGVEFDVACRLKPDPRGGAAAGWLGSLYQAPAGAPVLLSANAAVEHHGATALVRLAGPPPGAGVATLQYRYTVTLPGAGAGA